MGRFLNWENCQFLFWKFVIRTSVIFLLQKCVEHFVALYTQGCGKNTEQCLLNMCVVCFMLSWQSIDSFVRRLRVKVIHQACRPPYAYNKQQQSRNRLFLWSGRTYFSSFENSISLIVKSLYQACRLPYTYNIRNYNSLHANIAK